MEDQGIVELFFDRSEQAIVETDKKYGGYCYAIAYNILAPGRIRRRASAIHIFRPGIPSLPESLRSCRRFWGKSPGISPLTAGGSKVPRSGGARR